MRAFNLIFILLILLGCSNPDSTPDQKIISKESEMLFMCFNMGQDPGRIKSCQKKTPIIESDSLILFQDRNHFKGINYREDAYYSFDEYGLFEIQLDYYAKGFNNLDSIYTQLSNELTDDFGEPRIMADYLRWTTAGKSNSQIEISLSKDVDDNDSSFVSLNYLEPLNEEI